MLKQQMICHKEEIWMSSECFIWLKCRQSFGTEATPSIWFGSIWQRDEEFPHSHIDSTDVADCVSLFLSVSPQKCSEICKTIWSLLWYVGNGGIEMLMVILYMFPISTRDANGHQAFLKQKDLPLISSKIECWMSLPASDLDP